MTVEALDEPQVVHSSLAGSSEPEREPSGCLRCPSGHGGRPRTRSKALDADAAGTDAKALFGAWRRHDRSLMSPLSLNQRRCTCARARERPGREPRPRQQVRSNPKTSSRSSEVLPGARKSSQDSFEGEIEHRCGQEGGRLALRSGEAVRWVREVFEGPEAWTDDLSRARQGPRMVPWSSDTLFGAGRSPRAR